MGPGLSPSPATVRRGAFALLVLLVLGLHAWLGREVARWAPSLNPSDMPLRFQMADLKELKASAALRAARANPASPPPSPKPTNAPTARQSRAAPKEGHSQPPDPAASQPSGPTTSAPDATSAKAEAASAPSSEPASAASSLPGLADPATQVASSASPPGKEAPANTALASAAASASAPGAQAAQDDPTPGFRWPKATRIHYALRGYYNGEVYGRAKVDWARTGNRYQINLDVGVNLAMLEVFGRRMTSEGRIGAQGLHPERYDEETRIALKDPIRSSIWFEDQTVRLANGQQHPRLPGVQDTVSQFVQLSWLLATQSDRLEAGTVVELPLALPRNQSVWLYDVQEPEILSTPFGDLQTWHMIPRRKEHLGKSILLAETWLAPAYRYLPVRIRITQGAADARGEQTYLDLSISQPPLLAEDER
jgi:hypothetical protein